MTTSAHCLDLASMASRSRFSAGIVLLVAIVYAAMCIAVGNVSLDDWAMFTWSFGCTGSWEPSVPPTSWMHRLEITSLTFMFDWVPGPGLEHVQRELAVQLPADHLVADPLDQLRPSRPAAARPRY